MKKKLTVNDLKRYREYLKYEEKSKVTIEKYIRDISKFYQFLHPACCFEKQDVIDYKKYITDKYKVASVNSMLAALNGFFSFLGCQSYRVKSLKVQRRVFYSADKELRKEEYLKLLKTAKNSKNQRLYHIILTLGATGIRVSELAGFKVEEIKNGQISICSKNKNRIVLLPRELQMQLLQYAKANGIKTGSIFITANGKAMDRSNIWRQIKKAGRAAGINENKVFPHNLRHLFAKTYYQKEKDIVKLADILGHSNIETTRIYTMESGIEHIRQISRLGLII